MGYIAIALSLVIEDLPDVFARADVTDFVWPIVVLLLMYFFKLSRIAEQFVPRGLLVFLVLMTSLGTFVASLAGVLLVFGIPAWLETSRWRYLQAAGSLLQRSSWQR